MKPITQILKILGILIILLFLGKLSGIIKDNKSANTNVEQKQKTEDEILKEKITNQFSYYDGSHYKLVAFVKERLNDDESFKHVKTESSVYGNNILVFMKYRAKNGFGATILQSISAVYDIEGNLVRVIKVNGESVQNNENLTK
jgi:hypothetical protein